MNDQDKKASIEIYKNFIDDLVKIRPGVLSVWAESKGWPKTEENAEINTFLNELSNDQRRIIAQIIQKSRDGGIHDVLVYLSEEINTNELKIIKNDIEMAVEPFDTELFYD